MAEKRESNITGVTKEFGPNISDWISGMKAVQRTAKETARALKELEKVQGVDFAKGDLSKVTLAKLEQGVTISPVRVFVFTKETDPHEVRDEVSKLIPRGRIYHGEYLKNVRVDGFDFKRAIVIHDPKSRVDNMHFKESIHLTFEQWKILSLIFTKE